MPGSHGSLTKAGKVRMQTPKIDRTGVNATPKKIPRMRYRGLYEKRVLRQFYGGQSTSMGCQKHTRQISRERRNKQNKQNKK